MPDRAAGDRAGRGAGGEHVDADASPQQRRPVIVVRRWVTHGTGGAVLNVSTPPGGVRVAGDGGCRAVMHRGIETDHKGTTWRARRQHSVLRDQIGPRPRRRRRLLSKGLERRAHHLIRNAAVQLAGLVRRDVVAGARAGGARPLHESRTMDLLPFADWFERPHGIRIAMVGLILAIMSGIALGAVS